MRTILFKAKRVDNDDWMSGQLFVVGDFTYIFPLKIPGFVVLSIEKDKFKVIPETVCQFTGMKSQAGLDIYEGDIVEFNDYGNIKQAIVEWNNRSHSFVLSSPSYGKNFTRLSGRGKLCILGNIHD